LKVGGEVEGEGEGGGEVVVVEKSCRVDSFDIPIFALRATTKPITTAARLRRLKRRTETFA
jgi:hypothetical protein